MPLVASVDYPNKRIYLSADTVNTDLDTIDVWKEVATLRLSTASHRGFDPMIVPGGNIQKTATTFTPAYVVLLDGCRLVPFDTSHNLCLCRETFTDDNLAGQDVFDRTPLSPTTAVDIDVNVLEVEIRTITLSGTNVITGDIADVPNQVQTGMTAQGYTTNLATKLDASADDTTSIKAKTDQMQFTVANHLDVNIQYLNDAELIGDGTGGNSWRGLGVTP